jgi:hypothetical protein
MNEEYELIGKYYPPSDYERSEGERPCYDHEYRQMVDHKNKVGLSVDERTRYTKLLCALGVLLVIGAIV